MTKLADILGKENLFFDGGSGTILQSMGLKPGELPEKWNLTHAENVIKLNHDYFAAGSNIVNTNTFGAFITKFPLDLERIIKAAVDNANVAREMVRKEIKDKGTDLGGGKIAGTEGTDLGGGKNAGTEGTDLGISKNAGTEGTDLDSANRNISTQTTDLSPDKLFIAFDIGSCGKLLKPMGDLDFEDCISLYKKTFRIAVTCNIDCILIETMNDGYETKAAVIAAKEAMEEAGVSFPIIVTNVYDADCRTLSGSTPETMVAMLEGLGVSAVGVNCSLGPVEMLPTVERLCKAATVPVLVKPNAGLPKVVDGKTVFDVKPEAFVAAMEKIQAVPAYCNKILGGCCGTTPEYIKAMRDRPSISKQTSLLTQHEKETLENRCIISSNTKVAVFGHHKPCVLIGERINPTGKKKFKEALRNNDIDYIIHQGLEQETAGAEVLDVNVGLPEIDEKQMMVQVMTELQAVTDLPLQIDTSSAQVMEAALRRYNGKALINSVNGKQEIMDGVFPLVKKYGGVVIGLTLNEGGIPAESEPRVAIAKKIYEEAAKYGIFRKNIIIDPLAMSVSSDSQAGLATMETVRSITQMGGNTSLGISNVSFGLPNREFVTSAFFTMCMQNGLTAAIMNPLQQEMMKAYHCFNLLKGMDENCVSYINWASSVESSLQTVGESLPLASAGTPSSATPSNGGTPRNAPEAGSANNGGLSPLTNAIIKGLKNDAAAETKKLLENTDSIEIINQHLIPGLDFVGKRFEQKTMYLPQLLMAADAAKAAFGEIRDFMEKSGKKGETKGKIIIATVKGDIHDIGKNIVKVLLENYDFEVIDLGKDVPPETIVEACKKDHIELVGLSALMTTTVASMEETIKQLRKECPWAKVCVGGAVMTQEYSDQIGADFYGKDAMDTVRYACDLFSK